MSCSIMLILVPVASPGVRHLRLSVISVALQGSEAGPDHLVLNHLPFAEDLRVAKFTAFDEKTEYLPSEEQLDAMSELVRSLDLCSGSMLLPCTEDIIQISMRSGA